MRRSMSALMARSAVTECTFLFPVSFAIVSRAFEIESWFLEETTTLQPSEARTLATPSPIPLLEAGTRATLSLSPSSKMLHPYRPKKIKSWYELRDANGHQGLLGTNRVPGANSTQP